MLVSDVIPLRLNFPFLLRRLKSKLCRRAFVCAGSGTSITSGLSVIARGAELAIGTSAGSNSGRYRRRHVP
jgi:hypothetical protein